MTGVVRDPAGGIIPGATVVARTGGHEQQSVTGVDGRFAMSIEPGAEVVITVQASGFAEATKTIRPGTIATGLEFVLAPERVTEAVTVTATRGERRTSDVPASVNVLGREDIKQSPAVVADDVLRQIPTFSLFRRTSSLASHPTAQGVSLRGIGPSGVSRTLVHARRRADQRSVWRLGLLVQDSARDRRADRGRRLVELEPLRQLRYGRRHQRHHQPADAAHVRDEDRSTAAGIHPKVDLYGTRSHRQGRDCGRREHFRHRRLPDRSRQRTRTRRQQRGGQVLEREREGGLRRPPIGSTRSRGSGISTRTAKNGKASTIDGTEEANDTTWTSGSAGTRVRLPDESDLQATVFVDRETFHSNFLAVPAATPPRSIGRMTLTQTVPTTGVGGMVQWSRAFRNTQFFTAGADWRWVDGDSEENGLDAATGTQVVLNRVSGGTQSSAGFYVQDLIVPSPRYTVTLSSRVDHWRNYNGHNLETSAITGLPTAGNVPTLPDRDDVVVSPRAAGLYHLTSKIDVWGDMGWGFRAPTLNELYRQFRVGSTLTLANPALGPERLVGGEAGVTVSPIDALTIRSTWFDNRVTDPVSNVTDPARSTPTAITQQRQNLGKTRIWGIQNDLDTGSTRSWRVGGGYVYNQARVTENPSNPVLVGRYLPAGSGAPGSVRVSYVNARLATIAASVQLLGAQFDEDLNLPSRTLPKYAVADLTASRGFGRNLEVFLAVQNMFDAEYFVGTLPTTVGAPRFVSAGFRLRVGSR